MKLLLDTHAYLWWLADDSQLSADAREAIGNSSTSIFVSAVSIWEIAIKRALGKLELLDADAVYRVAESGFIELPISASHARDAGELPRHHEDPFDRMLVAQARHEGLTCVTRDSRFAAYSVSTLW